MFDSLPQIGEGFFFFLVLFIGTLTPPIMKVMGLFEGKQKCKIIEEKIFFK